MSVHPIEQAVKDFLSASAEGKAPLNEKLIEECMESIKLSLLDKFHTEPDNKFRLRMSNIGKDLRQLLLEKTYGRKKPSADFMLKMLTGSIQEHTLIYILKAAGLDIKVSGEVTLDVKGTKIDGTWDLLYDGKMYDVKTASDWSYKNKFASYATLVDDDSFGYVDQLLGYCEAEGVEPGGWVVINKSSGEVKVVTFPKTMAEVRESFLARVAKKIKDVEAGRMPPCGGVVAETFYQKPTGNRILGFKCKFCDHKEKCHPKISHEPSRVSKAKDPKMEYYV